MSYDDSPYLRPAAVDFSAVSKHFDVDGRAVHVLDKIDLAVGEGEFIAIVGSSGCGKSTLLRLLVGLDSDYDGAIQVNGQRFAGTSRERGIVFQEHRLFPWLNVEQNVALGLDSLSLPKAEKRELVRHHIALVGLQGFERALPHQLSGGMAQRVAIARGLVARPRILLLDEPFGALDALTRQAMQNELLRIWQTEKLTTLLVTHDVEEAIFLADRVVVMEPRPGRIRRIVDVNLPRPRRRASTDFSALKEDLLRDFADEAAPALIESTSNDPRDPRDHGVALHRFAW